MGLLKRVGKGVLCLGSEAGFAWKQEDVGREVLLWLMVWDSLRSEDHS